MEAKLFMRSNTRATAACDTDVREIRRLSIVLSRASQP